MAREAKKQVDNIIDIDLSVTQKQKIRIDGDDNRILLLNTADFGVVTRLKDMYPKLTHSATDAQGNEIDFGSDSDDEYTRIQKAGDAINTIDMQMREGLDYIFDSNVSEVCAPDGTMYDLFNGKFRFELIIEKLVELYGQRVKNEYSVMAARLKKHTSKYHK